MSNFIIKRLKTLHPEREYPANVGNRWTEQEHLQLLQELEQNLDYETIAKIHSRTIGGIISRVENHVLNMYFNSLESICQKTHLPLDTVMEIISKKK